MSECPGVSQCLSVSSFLLGSVPLSLSSLQLFLLTPLHFEVPEGLVSRRGSGGFCPFLSPEDASTFCSLDGRRGPGEGRPSRERGRSCPLGPQLRSSVPKLAHKSGRLCWGWGGPPAAWSPGTKASDWSLGARLRCDGLTSLGHQRVDWRPRRMLKGPLPRLSPAGFGWSHVPWHGTGRLQRLFSGHVESEDPFPSEGCGHPDAPSKHF